MTGRERTSSAKRRAPSSLAHAPSNEDARKFDADLVLLGTHGYSGVAQVFLGTVAGDILRDLRCDVLVVPPPRPRAAATG